MDRERFEDLKAAYALGALIDEERREFEAYLASHPELAREAEAMTSAASLLALSPEEQEPPPTLRRNLLREVEEREECQSLLQRGLAGLRESLSPRRIAVGAAALVLLVSIAFNALQQTEIQDLRDYEVRTHELQATSSGQEVQGQLIRLGEGRSILAVSGMPRPPEGKTYEIWTIEDGNPKPAGLFKAGEGQTVATVENSLGEADTVAVTVEPAGGSPKPTTDPVMVASI
jgi:anti-sigma-K factor RskA